MIGSKFIIALTPYADCLMIAVFSSAGKLVGDRVIPSQGLVCFLDADWCDGFTRYEHFFRTNKSTELLEQTNKIRTTRQHFLRL